MRVYFWILVLTSVAFGTPIKVLVDTDPGIDDALALALLFGRSDIFDIVGITNVVGNSPDMRQLGINTCVLMTACKHSLVDVVAGATHPLEREFSGLGGRIVHGQNGLGEAYWREQIDFSPMKNSSAGYNAAEYIIRQVRKHPNELTIVAIGPLINIALALRIDPEISELIKGIYIMGGAIEAPGNVNPAAEANFYNDPEAAHVVLNSGIENMYLFGLNLTLTLEIDPIILSKIRNIGPLGEYLGNACEYYMRYYRTKNGGRMAAPIHDPTTVLYLLNPEYFKVIPMHVDVETKGELTSGMTVASRKCGNESFPCNVKVVSEVVDFESVYKSFVDSIARNVQGKTAPTITY